MVKSMEEFWDAILSRNPNKIITAFKALPDQDKRNVIRHLNKMSTEDGWHAAQKISADTAIKIITIQYKDLNLTD